MPTTNTPSAEELRAPAHVENTTDATRGEPLAARAQKRKAELEAALEKLPASEVRARNDIELALSTVDGLLTGDVDQLSDVTASNLNRWLEQSKHLAERPPLLATEPATDPAT
jgi:hypothetical protein